MNKLDLIRDLTNANGISGFEHEVVEVVKNMLLKNWIYQWIP